MTADTGGRGKEETAILSKVSSPDSWGTTRWGVSGQSRAQTSQFIRDSGYEELLSSGIVICGGSAVMPGMVELGEDIFLKPVRRGNPLYAGALADMVANPRSATVMGLLEEARLARIRGLKVAAKAGSVKTVIGRAKDWFLGNF